MHQHQMAWKRRKKLDGGAGWCDDCLLNIYAKGFPWPQSPHTGLYHLFRRPQMSTHIFPRMHFYHMPLIYQNYTYTTTTKHQFDDIFFFEKIDHKPYSSPLFTPSSSFLQVVCGLPRFLEITSNNPHHTR